MKWAPRSLRPRHLPLGEPSLDVGRAPALGRPAVGEIASNRVVGDDGIHPADVIVVVMARDHRDERIDLILRQQQNNVIASTGIDQYHLAPERDQDRITLADIEEAKFKGHLGNSTERYWGTRAPNQAAGEDD